MDLRCIYTQTFTNLRLHNGSAIYLNLYLSVAITSNAVPNANKDLGLRSQLIAATFRADDVKEVLLLQLHKNILYIDISCDIDVLSWFLHDRPGSSTMVIPSSMSSPSTI